MLSVRGLSGLVVVALLSAVGFLSGPVRAEQYATTVELVVKDKKFEPAELKAPADKRIVIHVVNRDAAPMEFESKSLKVEKVVAANSEAIVRVGPLKPGKYEFFDDFNQKNRGALIVE